MSLDVLGFILHSIAVIRLLGREYQHGHECPLVEDCWVEALLVSRLPYRALAGQRDDLAAIYDPL